MDAEKIIDMLNQKGYKEIGINERLHRKTYRIVGNTISVYVNKTIRFDIRENDQNTGVDTYTASVEINDNKYKETTVDAYRFYQVFSEAIGGQMYGQNIIRGLTGVFALTDTYEIRFWHGAKSYKCAKGYNRRIYRTFSRNVEECKNVMGSEIKNGQVDIYSRYEILYKGQWWMPKIVVDSGMAYELVDK